jgi:hypothetical protein
MSDGFDQIPKFIRESWFRHNEGWSFFFVLGFEVGSNYSPSRAS